MLQSQTFVALVQDPELADRLHVQRHVGKDDFPPIEGQSRSGPLAHNLHFEVGLGKVVLDVQRKSLLVEAWFRGVELDLDDLVLASFKDPLRVLYLEDPVVQRRAIQLPGLLTVLRVRDQHVEERGEALINASDDLLLEIHHVRLQKELRLDASAQHRTVEA